MIKLRKQVLLIKSTSLFAPLPSSITICSNQCSIKQIKEVAFQGLYLIKDNLPINKPQNHRPKLSKTKYFDQFSIDMEKYFIVGVIIEIQHQTSLRKMKHSTDKRNNEHLEQSEEESDWLFDRPRKNQNNSLIPIFQLGKRLVRRDTIWTTLENQLYIQFLRQNYDLVDQKRQYNKGVLYHLMGSFIGSKNYAESRIHHHKMIRRYRSIEKIIKKIGKRYGGIYGTINRLNISNGVKMIVKKAQELETQRQEDFLSIANGQFWLNEQIIDDFEKQSSSNC